MKEGVIVLGHGSRREEANQELRELAGLVEKNAGGLPCRPAFLSFAEPTLGGVVQELVEEGVERIIVAPLFLVTGNHVKRDIPEEIERLQANYPRVQLVQASHLGVDPGLAEIALQRINKAREQA